jgi:hypothetical protein
MCPNILTASSMSILYFCQWSCIYMWALGVFFADQLSWCPGYNKPIIDLNALNAAFSSILANISICAFLDHISICAGVTCMISAVNSFDIVSFICRRYMKPSIFIIYCTLLPLVYSLSLEFLESSSCRSLLVLVLVFVLFIFCSLMVK